MKIHYDPQTDSLYIHLSTKPGVDSEAVTDDFVVDLGANGEPVGIDIQHAGATVDLAKLVAHNLPVTKNAVGDHAPA